MGLVASDGLTVATDDGKEGCRKDIEVGKKRAGKKEKENKDVFVLVHPSSCQRQSGSRGRYLEMGRRK